MYKGVGVALRSLALASRSQAAFPLRRPLVGRSIRLLSSGSDYTTILMPSLSPTMEAGVIGSWKKQPGDALAPGDVLCEIETDKASVAFEMQDDGVLAQILAKEQSGELKVGTPIAIMVEDQQAFQKFKPVDPATLLGGAAKSQPSQQPKQEQPQQPAAQQPAGHHAPASGYHLSPAAAHLVRSQNLDISGIKATGKHGKVRSAAASGSFCNNDGERILCSRCSATQILTKEDVLLALKSGAVKPGARQQQPTAAAAAPAAQPQLQQQQRQQQPQAPTDNTPANDRYTDIPSSSMRKTIAKRLTQSKTSVPHFYSTVEVGTYFLFFTSPT